RRASGADGPRPSAGPAMVLRADVGGGGEVALLRWSPERSGGAQPDLGLQVLGDRDLRQEVLGTGVLGRPAPTPLGRQDPSVEEQLPTPDTPRLTPHDGALEALVHHRAPGADRLGPSDVLELLREEDTGQRRLAVTALRLVPPVLVQLLTAQRRQHVACPSCAAGLSERRPLDVGVGRGWSGLVLLCCWCSRRERGPRKQKGRRENPGGLSECFSSC